MFDTWLHVRAGHYIIVTIISARHVVARTGRDRRHSHYITDNTPGTQGDTGNLEICALEIWSELYACQRSPCVEPVHSRYYLPWYLPRRWSCANVLRVAHCDCSLAPAPAVIIQTEWSCTTATTTTTSTASTAFSCLYTVTETTWWGSVICRFINSFIA